MAVALRQQDGTLSDSTELEREWRDNLRRAWDYRKQFEPTMLSNLAFAKGQHWLVYDEKESKMRHLSEVDPRYEDRELVTVDKLNEHVQAQLGELQSDDDRPELLLAQDGDAAEDVQAELNDLVAHGWEYEWQCESSLEQTDGLCLALGVSAIRVRSEQTREVAGYLTLDAAGQQVDEAGQAHLAEHGMLPDGSLPRQQPVYERRTIWEPLSALNLLTPPGINHEDWFPWEAVMRPAPLDDVKEQYPAAADLVEDDDIGSLIGITTSQTARTGGDQSASKGRLRGFVWLFTVFVRPCARYPKGMKLVLATNQMKLLDVQPELDYKTPSGEYRAGLHYFHWWRNRDTFWSRAMIEPLKDPQRIINRRETQKGEIIDRGMPKTFVKEGTLKHNPAGLPLEVIELKADANEPSFFPGMGPGEWINQDLAHQADNLAHASTLSPLRLGENPTNVDTLGQLALLNENESAKRAKILKHRKRAIARCVEDSVVDIRRYWPKEKRILVEGDGEEGAIRQRVFEKSKIPDFFVVRPAKGSSKPRSQGAELTKVDAIWNAALGCGVAAAPNGAKWIEWYAKSLDAGQALELPEAPADSQVEMARFENWLMLEQGEDVEPQDYDLFPAHIPEHRVAQNQARASEDWEAFARIQRHVKASVMLQAQNAASVQQAQQVPSPITPPPAAAGPPGPPGPPPPGPPPAPVGPLDQGAAP